MLLPLSDFPLPTWENIEKARLSLPGTDPQAQLRARVGMGKGVRGAETPKSRW